MACCTFIIKCFFLGNKDFSPVEISKKKTSRGATSVFTNSYTEKFWHQGIKNYWFWMCSIQRWFFERATNGIPPLKMNINILVLSIPLKSSLWILTVLTSSIIWRNDTTHLKLTVLSLGAKDFFLIVSGVRIGMMPQDFFFQPIPTQTSKHFKVLMGHQVFCNIVVHSRKSLIWGLLVWMTGFPLTPSGCRLPTAWDVARGAQAIFGRRAIIKS